MLKETDDLVQGFVPKQIRLLDKCFVLFFKYLINTLAKTFVRLLG